MKILAIRGCNLASLAGEFEIDLANGPLGVAGVFAIVGPTGAGKSTLLDAMCVALFDRTPRLPGHSRVTVGHGEEDPLALGAQDPRTLLRRGATQGWAEVDFESGDTRRYRARWSVRRARGATDGNLQDQQVSLTAIDVHSVITERLGGTKTETLKAIHQRLGLTFDQFRRSALLAQGDFAAFLRAEGKDRSELLERMTGTEIYSKLSIAAHTRAVLAEQALRERQAAALAIAVLDDDTRSNARAELERARVEREAARHRLADAEKLAVWRSEAALRAASLAQAETEHGLAEAEARGAEPLRSELVLRRRAEALRAVWDEAARLDRQHSIAQGDLARAAAAATAAELAKTETVATHARIADLHATIRAARMAAAIVELEVPKRLARGTIASPALPGGAAPPNGGAVSIASPALPGGAAPPNGGAVSIAPPIRGASSVVGHAEERAHAALEPATWLVARRALAPEILAWPELDAKLGQERSLAEGIAAADRVLADQTIHHAALVAKEAAVQRARELAQHRLLEATREAEGFVKRRTLGLDAAGRAEDEARTRCGEVERLITISGGARTAANILTELESRFRDLETEAAADRERRAQTETGRDAAALLRDERARVVAELRKAAGYQHARTELVAEEPCPLCGALEHPWKHKGAFDALIADAERTLAEATTQWESATKLIAQLDARDSHRDAERARFASTRSTAQTSVEALAREWAAQLAALGELSLVTDPAHPAAERLAIERTEAARTRLESARATRSAAAAAHKAVAEAQARVQVCQADLDHHLAELRELAATVATITAAVERIAAERASRIERHVELARDLEAIVARWEAALPVEERASLKIVATVAVPVPVAKRGRGAKRGAATAEIGSSAGASSVSRAESSRGERVAHAPRGQADVDSTGSRAEPSRAELARGITATVSGPRGATPTDAGESSRGELVTRGASAIDRTRFADLVQAWRDRATIVAQAEASLVAALVEVDRAGLDAERAVADTAARQAECAKRSRELAAELVAATTALDDARIAAGFDREALHRALADDPSRVDILAVELDRLGLAVDRARTRIAERTRLVADHETARPMPRLDRAAMPTANPDVARAAPAGGADIARARTERDDDSDIARAPAPERDDDSDIARARAPERDDDSDIARARAERIAKANAARDLIAEARARVELDADRVPELAAAVKAADQRAAELAATLAADDDARKRRDDAFASFKAAERAAEVDRVLGQVIGSHDGKLFRSFAQSLTLDQLLGVANSHLEELAPRYQLERVPKHDLELQVIDRDFGGEVRSVQSLSGGESFLVSLALALGLSSMSAHDVRVRTLLIDEGFGTLDPATLDSALAVLDELQATGRQVGIISHVPALLDRVRAHVRVTPRGGGRSDVHVPPN